MGVGVLDAMGEVLRKWCDGRNVWLWYDFWVKMSYKEVASSSYDTRRIALALTLPAPCPMLKDAMTTTVGRGMSRGNPACRIERWWIAQTFGCTWYPDNSLRCGMKVYLYAVISGSQTSGDGASAG